MPVPPVATDIGIPEDASIEAANLEMGGVATPYEPFYAVEEEEEPVEAYDPDSDTGFLGQVYGSTVRGFTGGLSGTAKSLAIAAARMDRWLGIDDDTDPREGGFYALGGGLDWLGDAITPDESIKYGKSFAATTAPHAIGNMLSFIVGTKGLGAGFKAATMTVKGGARGIQRGAIKRVGTKAAKLSEKRVAAGGAAVSPAIIRKAAKTAAMKDTAKLASRATYAGAGAMGMGMSATEGWEDAMRVLEARAAAEGRELTDAEREMAWSSYKWNGFIGLTEIAPLWGFLKHLDKFVPGTKSRLRHAITTGGVEAVQEFGQSVMATKIASHIVGYDKGRKLFDEAFAQNEFGAGAAGGVAGAVMGLLTYALGKRVRWENKAKKHRENARKIQASGSTAETANQARLEIVKAEQIEAMLGRIDVESGAAAERAKEEAAAAPTEETAPTEAVVPTEGAASTEEVSVLSKSRRFKQEIPVEEEAAPVEAEEVVATEEAAKPTKNPVAKNVLDNKTLMARAKKHGIDPADAPVGKKGKVTLGTLRQFIKEEIAAEETAAEEVAVGDSALSEAMAEEEAAPPEEVAPEGAGGTATDYSDMGGADVGAAPAKDAATLLAESIASTTEATAGAVESADARDAAAHEAIRDRAAENIAESEAVLAKAGELVPVEGTEGEHRVTNESGRTYSLVENARGDVTVYDGNEIEILHRADSLEEAQAAVNSGELDAIHDAKTREEEAEEVAEEEVAEEEVAEEEVAGEDEHSRTNAGTGEVFATAAEARESERAELEEDSQADVEASDIVVQGGVSFDLSELTTEERGSDEVKAVMANVAAKTRAAEKDVGAPKGHFYVRITMQKLPGGGAAEANVYGNLREIVVSVPGTTKHLKGNDNLQEILGEEMQHQLDATAVRFAYEQEVEAGTINPDEVSYADYYDGHYIEVFEGMSAEERQEAITRYHPNNEVASQNNKMSRLEQEAQKGDAAARTELNQKKIDVAREYVRMLLQQRSTGVTSESKYNRKVRPVLGKLMRMLHNFYVKITGEWSSFRRSSRAMNRVKEAEAIAELLKKDAVRVEVNYESGREGGAAGAAKAGPAESSRQASDSLIYLADDGTKTKGKPTDTPTASGEGGGVDGAIKQLEGNDGRRNAAAGHQAFSDGQSSAGAVLDAASLSKTLQKKYLGEGTEHWVARDTKSGQVIKVTKPASFAGELAGRDYEYAKQLAEQIESGAADPDDVAFFWGRIGDASDANISDYLNRILASNYLFDDNIQLLGITSGPVDAGFNPDYSPPPWLQGGADKSAVYAPQIVTSQPFVKSKGHASEAEIAAYLTKRGWKKDERDKGEKPSWSNGQFTLWDAKGANFLKDADGKIKPIDVQVELTAYAADFLGGFEAGTTAARADAWAKAWKKIKEEHPLSARAAAQAAEAGPIKKVKVLDWSGDRAVEVRRDKDTEPLAGDVEAKKEKKRKKEGGTKLTDMYKREVPEAAPKPTPPPARKPASEPPPLPEGEGEFMSNLMDTMAKTKGRRRKKPAKRESSMKIWQEQQLTSAANPVDLGMVELPGGREMPYENKIYEAVASRMNPGQAADDAGTFTPTSKEDVRSDIELALDTAITDRMTDKEKDNASAYVVSRVMNAARRYKLLNGDLIKFNLKQEIESALSQYNTDVVMAETETVINRAGEEVERVKPRMVSFDTKATLPNGKKVKYIDLLTAEEDGHLLNMNDSAKQTLVRERVEIAVADAVDTPLQPHRDILIGRLSGAPSVEVAEELGISMTTYNKHWEDAKKRFALLARREGWATNSREELIWYGKAEDYLKLVSEHGRTWTKKTRAKLTRGEGEGGLSWRGRAGAAKAGPESMRGWSELSSDAQAMVRRRLAKSERQSKAKPFTEAYTEYVPYEAPPKGRTWGNILPSGNFWIRPGGKFILAADDSELYESPAFQGDGHTTALQQWLKENSDDPVAESYRSHLEDVFDEAVEERGDSAPFDEAGNISPTIHYEAAARAGFVRVLNSTEGIWFEGNPSSGSLRNLKDAAREDVVSLKKDIYRETGDRERSERTLYDPDRGRAGAAKAGPPANPLLELSEAVAEEQAERIANNGEAPVAPISPGNGVYHRLKHMLSPWRWAMGGEDLLRRAGLHDLADSLREYYDAESVLLGGFFSGYREMSESYSYDEWTKAQDEFSEYMLLRERGYKMPEEAKKYREEAEKYLNEKVGKAGKELIAWQKKQAVFTGKLSTELNVQVYDTGISQAPGFKMVPDGKGGWKKESLKPNRAGWRPMGDMGEWHFPRMFTQDTFDIITNRNTPEYREKYKQLLLDMVDNGNAEHIEVADAMMQQAYKDTTGGDYFANLERARGVKLPDKYYDHSSNAYLHFLRRYSERIAQIQSFGQSMDGRVEDAWDMAKKQVGNKLLEDDIDLLQKTVYRQRPKWEGGQGIASWGTGVSSMLFLSGPLTSIRNLTSALRMNMESFGFINTAEATYKNFKQSAAAIAKTAAKMGSGEYTWKFWKDGAKTVTPQMVAEAHAIGALRMDFQTAQLLDLYSDSPVYDEKSAKARLVQGNTMALWMHGATERMGRSISYTAGLQWLRATREVVKNENGDYLQRLALMKRLGFHTEAQRKAVLDGDASEVNRFLRSTVREKQFSYDVSQSPLFFSSPMGRFFFQFQKWGFQRLRDMGRNVVAPMLGEGKVHHKGKEMTVKRDFKPFIRMMLLAQGAGELYALLRELLTDRERKEGDLAELSRTYDANEQRAIMLGAERMLNNLVLDGGLGIMGDYSGLAYDMSSRGWRYKNPLEPPSIQLGKEFVGMITDRVQRQSLTEGLNDDIADFLRTVPLLRQPSRAVGQMLDATGSEIDWVQRQQAWRDVSGLRNAARRFANETGLDEGRSMNFIFDAKTPNSALYDDVHRALLIGEFEEVREIRLGILKDKNRTPAQRKKDMLALRTSVRNRQPLKVGGVENKEARAAFLRWLKERRPDEVNTLMEVQGRYMKAAARAGLR